MPRTFRTRSIAPVLTLLSPLALAHPGEHHGGLLHNLLHLVSEPYHLALIVLAVLGGFAGARLFRHRAASRAQQPRR